MEELRYRAEPAIRHAPGLSVSAVFRPDDAADEMEVVVMLSRAAGEAPTMGSEVEAELLDDGGSRFAVIARAEGRLVELSGIGVSVNAPFRFRLRGRRPAGLRVRYRNKTYAFQVREEI